MTIDLEQRIADLAAAWDRDTAPVSLDELVGTTASGPITTVELVRTIESSHRRWMILSVGAAAAIAAIVVLAVRREPDSIDPVAPATIATTVTTVHATVDAITVPTAPATTVAPTTAPTTVVPSVMTDADAAAALAAFDAERSEALRGITTIGFRVHGSTTFPDGQMYDDGSIRDTDGVELVFRNDGSAAIVSDTFGVSYYDAAAGIARAVFTDAAGQPAYQEVVGQANGSMGVGVPTGLVNGIITSISQLRPGLVAIVDDVLDGRPAWRIDQLTENLVARDGSMSRQQTWIDQATGITVQTHTSGSTSIDDVALDEIITLTDLEPGTPMPADFPNPFPAEATVAVSGDPTAFAPITLDQAAAEFDAPLLVPSLPGAQVSIERMNFGTEISPVLHVQWFDGFVRTELRIDQYPSMMDWPDTCSDCTIGVLDELRAAPLTIDGVYVARDNVGVTLTGDPDTIRAVIASLTQLS